MKVNVEQATILINTIIGDDYSKFATINLYFNLVRYNELNVNHKVIGREWVAVSFNNGNAPTLAFNTETLEFHPDFIKLCDSMKAERFFLEENVELTFKNLKAVRNNLTTMDVARLYVINGQPIEGLCIYPIPKTKEDKNKEYYENFYPYLKETKKAIPQLHP